MPMLRCLWPSVLMYRAATALAAVLVVLVLVHAAESDARDEGAAARTTEAADERPPKRAPAAAGRWANVRRRVVAMVGRRQRRTKMSWLCGHGAKTDTGQTRTHEIKSPKAPIGEISSLSQCAQKHRFGTVLFFSPPIINLSSRVSTPRRRSHIPPLADNCHRGAQSDLVVRARRKGCAHFVPALFFHFQAKQEVSSFPGSGICFSVACSPETAIAASNRSPLK